MPFPHKDFNICKMVLFKLNQLVKTHINISITITRYFKFQNLPKNSQVPPFANRTRAVRDLLQNNKTQTAFEAEKDKHKER